MSTRATDLHTALPLLFVRCVRLGSAALLGSLLGRSSRGGAGGRGRHRRRGTGERGRRVRSAAGVQVAQLEHMERSILELRIVIVVLVIVVVGGGSGVGHVVVVMVMVVVVVVGGAVIRDREQWMAHGGTAATVVVRDTIEYRQRRR